MYVVMVLFLFTLRCVLVSCTFSLYHTVMWKLYCLSACCDLYFSESAKGSDSEDDFLRVKSKAKAASDSDSDSDVGTKKGKMPFEQTLLLLHT